MLNVDDLTETLLTHRGQTIGKAKTWMTTIVNAGARLDRLPISSFHYRIFWLIAAGMFFDGYDLYVAGPSSALPFRVNFRHRVRTDGFYRSPLSA